MSGMGVQDIFGGNFLVLCLACIAPGEPEVGERLHQPPNMIVLLAPSFLLLWLRNTSLSFSYVCL
jgi:hypothetical protein